jgi:hypothetical protein
MATQFFIDLTFSLVEPAVDVDGEHRDESTLSGTIKADGGEIEVFADNPGLMMQRGIVKVSDVRGVAGELAKLGISISLAGPDGVIAKIGDVNAPLSQRILTRSPNISVGNAKALAPLLKRPSKTAVPITLPPMTLFPIVPTISRRIRVKASTTHALRGEGRPRLIFVVGSQYWDGQMPREFDLKDGTTTIGSGPDVDLQLEGLDELHGEIQHDERDEYRFVAHGEAGGIPQPEGGQILRTGARIEMGKWKLAFFREEFADHGRPFGGRLGGELARQRPQQDRRESK